MSKETVAVVHIVYGPQGAGKSTYARQLATRVAGIHLSIDVWMAELFGPDLPKPINLAWVMERVSRCERRIWATAAQVARRGGTVVLDLGFMKAKNRAQFVALAASEQLSAQLHFVSAPHDVRRKRVLARNVDRGESFSFEVTPTMFDFMEHHFEAPTQIELAESLIVETH